MNFKNFIPFLILLVNSCAFKSNSTIMVNDTERDYTIHLPNSYSKHKTPYPILFVLHGNPSKSWQMKLYTGMNATSDTNEFIVVYPDATDNRWYFLDKKIVHNELEYFRFLLDDLKRQYNIDASKIYVSGMSGGGIFSLILTQVFPDEIAAVCVVAGNMIKLNQFPVPINSTAMPLMLIHGTSDYIYEGTESLLSVQETLDYWIKVNNCNSNPVTTLLPDVNKKDKSFVTTLQYPCKDHNDILFYKIDNGGHHWPNSKFNANKFVKRDLGELNKDFDTNQEIWNFVSRHEVH